jgi:ferric-dicitrate binding protein FerR (iron transport regulator)
MSPSLVPIDSSTAAAIKTGDESALERLFRAEFGPMTAEAEETLHDPRAATRAATKAFVDLWRARDTVSNAEEMDALLKKVLREEVLDVHRRMVSVHRHAKAGAAVETVPTVGESWAKVLEGIHPAAVDARQRDADRIEQAKHHTADHLKALDGKGNKTWLALLGLVVAIAGAVGIVMLLNQHTETSRVSLALKAPQAVKIPTKEGQQGNVQIAGGGTALIGPASELTIPQDFLTTVFALEVAGTARLTLPATKAPQQMEVRAGNAAVFANGVVTVRAYKDEDYVAVRLDKGDGKLVVGKTEQPLVIGQVVRISKEGAAAPVDGPVATAALGWTDNRYVVNDVTVKAALLDLRRWFGTQAQCNDKEVLERKVSLDIALDSPRLAVEALTKAANAKLGFIKNISVIYDPKRPI